MLIIIMLILLWTVNRWIGTLWPRFPPLSRTTLCVAQPLDMALATLEWPLINPRAHFTSGLTPSRWVWTDLEGSAFLTNVNDSGDSFLKQRTGKDANLSWTKSFNERWSFPMLWTKNVSSINLMQALKKTKFPRVVAGVWSLALYNSASVVSLLFVVEC